MKQLKRNLQRENFHEIMQEMQQVPGWEIMEEEGFLALKSPTELDFINFVWAESNIANIQKAKQFYANQSFSWVIPSSADPKNLLADKFDAPEPSPEMVFDLSSYQTTESVNDSIEIIQVKTDAEFEMWCKIAGKVFHYPAEGLAGFFKPLADFASFLPYLAFYDSKPVGTVMLFLGKETAGIYAMGVLKEYRRHGVGRLLVETCLAAAKNCGKQQVILSASELGKMLYESIGFVVTQNFDEYLFAASEN